MQAALSKSIFRLLGPSLASGMLGMLGMLLVMVLRDARLAASACVLAVGQSSITACGCVTLCNARLYRCNADRLASGAHEAANMSYFFGMSLP